MTNTEVTRLHSKANFALFVTSYLPLFLLIIFKQIVTNFDYFNFTGITQDGIICLISKFGISIILFLVSIFGFIGFSLTIRNIEEIAENGIPVKVKKVSNKNSEAIGYMATYIIPFLFEDFTGWFESISILFLLFIIYRIYINSSLLLINPILSMSFSIYELEYELNNKIRTGMIVMRSNNLQEDTTIKIYEIGHKLFFSKNIT